MPQGITKSLECPSVMKASKHVLYMCLCGGEKVKDYELLHETV